MLVCRISRRSFFAFVRYLASDTNKDEEIITRLGEATHIPAPEIDRPTVSPITQLGTTSPEPERVSQDAGDEAAAEREEAEPTVITWLGEKPKEMDEVRKAAEEARMKADRLEKSRAAYPDVRQLPFDLLPKFVNIMRAPKITEPMEFSEALRSVMETSSKDHDDTIKLDIRLGIDPKKSDQFVRGLSVLPHGTGKTLRIAVFAEGLQAQQAREAKVALVGGPELVQEVIDTEGAVMSQIDRCLATPSMMSLGIAKLGKILGPRGLMPNPKTGTLTDNISEAIQKLRQGQIEFRVDRFGVLHAPIGKVSFGIDKLRENTEAYISDVLQHRPTMFRQKSIAEFLRSVTLSSPHGRGRPVTVSSLGALSQIEGKL